LLETSETGCLLGTCGVGRCVPVNAGVAAQMHVVFWNYWNGSLVELYPVMHPCPAKPDPNLTFGVVYHFVCQCRDAEELQVVSVHPLLFPQGPRHIAARAN